MSVRVKIALCVHVLDDVEVCRRYHSSTFILFSSFIVKKTRELMIRQLELNHAEIL